jgi:hypothetical protein
MALHLNLLEQSPWDHTLGCVAFGSPSRGVPQFSDGRFVFGDRLAIGDLRCSELSVIHKFKMDPSIANQGSQTNHQSPIVK